MLCACASTVFICGARFSGDICLRDGFRPHREVCHSSGVLEEMRHSILGPLIFQVTQCGSFSPLCIYGVWEKGKPA